MSDVTFWSWAVDRCAALDKGCQVDWDAWAAAAGWFGGLGGWAAAFATVLAVVLPYRRDVKRARYRAYVGMKAFRGSLNRLAQRLDVISSIRGTLANGDYQPHAGELDALLGLVLDVPLFDLDPELDEVLTAINALRSRVEAWHQIVAVLKAGAGDPVAPRTGLAGRLKSLGTMLDEMTTAIHEAIETAEEAIDRTKFGSRRP